MKELVLRSVTFLLESSRLSRHTLASSWGLGVLKPVGVLRELVLGIDLQGLAREWCSKLISVLLWLNGIDYSNDIWELLRIFSWGLAIVDEAMASTTPNQASCSRHSLAVPLSGNLFPIFPKLQDYDLDHKLLFDCVASSLLYCT